MSQMPMHMFRSLDEIAVSDAALQMARGFDEAARSSQPDKAWIVCFDWGDSRRRRQGGEPNAWTELGPGLDLVAFERQQVPDEAVQSVGGFLFAIKIPLHIVAQAQDRMVDVVKHEGGMLKIR